jgi:hypothetical protein
MSIRELNMIITDSCYASNGSINRINILSSNRYIYTTSQLTKTKVKRSILLLDPSLVGGSPTTIQFVIGAQFRNGINRSRPLR